MRGQSKLEVIQKESTTVKDKIVTNLIENREDQSQKQTIIEFASAFDLSRKCDKHTRVEYIKQLHLMYGQDCVHTLLDEEFS